MSLTRSVRRARPLSVKTTAPASSTAVESPASVDCGGHNRNSRHNRACSFLRTIPALDIHKRPTGNRARLHQTFTDFLGIHVFNALRNYVGVSSRLRHILGTGSPHNNRRLRHKSILDIRRFPSSPTFKTIMYAYPISLSLTAVLIFIALLAYHPSRRFKGAVSAE